MEETGIEDERTLARYERFSDSERREMLSKTDNIGLGVSSTSTAGMTTEPRALLEGPRQHAPVGKEQAWNMILEGLLGF